MTEQSPAGGMTDTQIAIEKQAQDLYFEIVGARDECTVSSERIAAFYEGIKAIAEAITTARTEALREAAGKVRELAVAMHKQPAVGHPHDHLARECGDAALQAAAELVEALIKTDSGVNLDVVPR